MDNPLLDTVTNNNIDTLIESRTLQERITELANEITIDYQNQEFLLVCILRGGVVFLTDLMRQISIPHRLDFMAVSSYADGRTKSEGRVRITMDLLTDIEDFNVLLVEDIVDTGHTLKQVLELLNSRSPKSLRVCTLLDKHERREVDIKIDYVGFQIPDKFVIGYGLDDENGYWRNLPYVGVARPQ
jgi:hypoxanthine phosphoribosyltransferase